MRRTPYYYRGPKDPGDGETECPDCEGQGEVIDYSRVHGGSIDPPMGLCETCGGSGVVEDDSEPVCCCRCGDEIDEERICGCESDSVCEDCCDCEE